jgi:hypothetical protein
MAGPRRLCGLSLAPLLLAHATVVGVPAVVGLTLPVAQSGARGPWAGDGGRRRFGVAVWFPRAGWCGDAAALLLAAGRHGREGRRLQLGPDLGPFGPGLG